MSTSDTQTATTSGDVEVEVEAALRGGLEDQTMQLVDEALDREARTQAVRALESEFGDLIGRVRKLLADNAERMSPGMLPGAYKVFTTIVRRERVTLSTLAESLMADKGQVSRTVRELEQLGFVQRTPDPEDGRSSLLSPTALGLERLAIARAPQEHSLLSALDAWSIEQIDELTRLLHALTAGTAPAR